MKWETGQMNDEWPLNLDHISNHNLCIYQYHMQSYMHKDDSTDPKKQRDAQAAY